MTPRRPSVIERTPLASAEGRASRGAWAGRLAEGAARLLAPPRCAGCGWFCEHLFCEACAPRVRRVDEETVCERCGERLGSSSSKNLCADCWSEAAAPIEVARSLWMLGGPVRHAIHELKYLGHTDLALSLGAHLGASARLGELFAGACVVVPVPLHPWREWKRGFNQSALLARAAAREMGVPCDELLRRVRHTPTQTSLTRAQRDANVRAAFATQPKAACKYLQGQSCGLAVLVDDVWTTGATLRECARALRESGFARVAALTVARRGK